MKRTVEWDRRRFLQLMASTSSLGIAGSRFGWAVSQAAPARKANFAYIGAEHEIHVYSIAADERFIRQQTIFSAHPVAMAISGGNLYVANGVSEFGNLPCGSVEAYGIDASTGRLELKNRVALSLSGILPRDLAISPDGRSLVVAVHGGGAYNVLPIQADGRLGRVSGILKEVGSGPHASQAAAHPSAVIFDRFGRLLTADQGTDKLSVISLSNGEPMVADRCKVIAGSGPSSIVLDHNGKRLFVAHALNGLVSSFNYNEKAGRILDRTNTVQASAVGEMAMLAMHPSGEMLYSSHGDGMDVWKIAANGSLEALTGVGGVQVNGLYVTADGKNLLALSGDGVLRMKINPATHLPSAPAKVATVSKPVSIAIL
jgi:6-phosphogluconolactonase (cycloisomerase 2 family)